MKYTSHNKKQSFFAGKGFYLVLALCIVAVGAAAWSAMSAVSSVEDKLTSPDSSYSSGATVSNKTENVGQTVSDVPNKQQNSSLPSQKAETSSKTEESKTQISESSEKDVAFAMPIKGNIGKAFSSSALQYSATYGDMRLHLGVDVLAEKGAEVVSAAAGKITKIADDALWGRMVVIDHGNGIICYYCGVENNTVSEGETVKAGTVLGEVGTVPCECADKSHIHIAVVRDGKYISPLDILSQN